jgi:broad specificity phosphatase PhoE
MTEPAMTEPAMTEPAMTEPAMTEPAVTEPAVTEVVVVQDVENEDVDTEAFETEVYVNEPGGVAELVVVRHGQSTANKAFAAGRPGDVSGPDAAIPLTQLGERQSAALGDAIASWPAARRSDIVLCSPYVRARRTYEIAAAAAEAQGVTLPSAIIDERLEDRHTGAFELMPLPAVVTAGSDVFFDRPSGGESLADVADRLAAVLVDVNRAYPGRRVLLVAHDAVVAVLHYLIDRPTMDEFVRHLGENPAANASVTRWVDSGEGLRMVDYSRVDHLAGVTAEHGSGEHGASGEHRVSSEHGVSGGHGVSAEHGVSGEEAARA